MGNITTNSTSRLVTTRTHQQVTYALPVVATAFLISPLAVVQGIYAKYFGLSLTSIATVLLVARIFDAVTDPLIGYWSDRYYQRTGSRKPFIILGGVLLIISGYFLYVPVGWGTLTTVDWRSSTITVGSHYFLVWFLLFYFAWTLFEIPHMAWGSDLTTGAMGKSRIYSWRYAGTTIGLLAFYAIPLLPFFRTNEFTPISLFVAMILAAGLMIPLLYISMKMTPASATGMQEKASHDNRADMLCLVKETVADKPLLLFFSAIALLSIGVPGMWFTLIFIYADTYLKLGNDFALVSLVSPGVGLLFLVIWYRLSARLGKKVTLALAMLCSTVGVVMTGFLSPRDSGFLSLLFVMILCYGLGTTANAALSPSLLSDIIDYHRWKFGNDRTATYFAMYTLVAKGALAIGGALGLGIAGIYGFDPAEQSHNADNIAGLRLAISWVPAAMVFCAALLFLLNPMTTHRHDLIRRRLNASERRAMPALPDNTAPQPANV